MYGALAYAYSSIFFASTVVYALAAGSKNWAAITHEFGGWFTLHGAIMVIGGLAFGLAIIQAAVLPRWTAACRGRAGGGRGGNVHRGPGRGRCPAAGRLRRHERDGAAGTLADPEAAGDPRAVAAAPATDTNQALRDLHLGFLACRGRHRPERAITGHG